MSLDRIHDYLAWPPDALDPHRLAAQTQAVRVLVLVNAKVGINALVHAHATRRLSSPVGSARLSQLTQTRPRGFRRQLAAASFGKIRGAQGGGRENWGLLSKTARETGPAITIRLEKSLHRAPAYANERRYEYAMQKGER
jgi:hypothetical protein